MRKIKCTYIFYFGKSSKKKQLYDEVLVLISKLYYNRRV